MNCTQRPHGIVCRTLPIVLALFFSGCAIISQKPDSEPDTGTTAVESAPAPEASQPPMAETPVASESGLFTHRVAIILSDRKAAYENVATELGAMLQDFAIYDLTDKSLTPRGVFSNIADYDAGLVVAIGLRAATVANAYSKVPVVFCQVFNTSEIDLRSNNLKGVAALPPLSMQVKAWQQLNPNLQHIGAILGDGHEELLAEARKAADSAGLTLHHRTARSDRETLYLFNRLTPDIDGFWLFPDNRVLSPSVLRQMLSYASRHRVQVAVFNPALLEFGAALSATSVNADIAETVVSVAHRVIRGDGDSIPTVTPLNRIEVKTNDAVIKTPQAAAASGDGTR